MVYFEKDVFQVRPTKRRSTNLPTAYHMIVAKAQRWRTMEDMICGRAKKVLNASNVWEERELTSSEELLAIPGAQGAMKTLLWYPDVEAW